MAEKAKHTDPKDKGKFSHGKTEAPRKSTSRSPRTRPRPVRPRRSKGGRRERETK